MLKNRHWPSLYTFEAPGLCPETQEEQMLKVPVLLPHEILAVLQEKNHSSQGFCDHSDLAPVDQERLAAAARQMGTTVFAIAGLGLWGDGAPYSSDRTKSIEVLAFNIVTHKEKDLRFPIAIVPKHWTVKNATYDAIFQILTWSFTCLAMACWPATDHAGQPWGVGQSSRKKKAGQPLPRAILLQVRGDWSFCKNTLNGKANCCWLCDCTPDRTIEASAFSARKKKTSWEAIAPLLGIPFFDLSMLALDWLHIVDLGIAQQFLGSTFKHVAKKFRKEILNCNAKHCTLE
eukprot:Skav220790  [mRNA]  locus=scaffold116:29192:30212:- [translate_table: standard]